MPWPLTLLVANPIMSQGLSYYGEPAALWSAAFFTVPVAPLDRPWMWASGHSAATVTRAAHGYEAMREAAIAAFAKSWRRAIGPRCHWRVQ